LTAWPIPSSTAAIRSNGNFIVDHEDPRDSLAEFRGLAYPIVNELGVHGSVDQHFRLSSG
jgi:hypothetical protein